MTATFALAFVLNLAALVYGADFLIRRPLSGLALIGLAALGFPALTLTLAALTVDVLAHAIGQARRLADRLACD